MSDSSNPSQPQLPPTPSPPRPEVRGPEPPESPPTFAPAGSPSGRTIATLAHVLAIFFFLLGPLVLWLLKREEDPFIDDQGREVINWEITALIAWFISITVGYIMGFGFLAPLVFLVKIVFNVVGAVRSSEGQRFRYPYALRLLR